MFPIVGEPLALLGNLLLFMLLVYVVVTVFRAWEFSEFLPADQRDSLELLKARLDKGEISKIEFNELKSLL